MRRRTILVAAASVVAATVAFIGPASAARPSSANHCVVTVVGQSATGELVTSQPRCFATFADAMSWAGVDTEGLADPSPSGLAAAGRLQMGVTSIIGIHYDGYNWTGASMTVSGTNCGGGWLNVSPAWNDRISSTANGCPRVRHFRDANLSGGWQDTLGSGGNLSVLDNNTTSIQYLT